MNTQDENQPPKTAADIVDGWIVDLKTLTAHMEAAKRNGLTSRPGSLALTKLEEAIHWLVDWQVEIDKAV